MASNSKLLKRLHRVEAQWDWEAKAEAEQLEYLYASTNTAAIIDSAITDHVNLLVFGVWEPIRERLLKNEFSI